MIDVITRAFRFLSPKEKVSLLIFLSSRAIVTVFDLLGILGIGLMSASIGLFLSEGSDPDRVFEFGTLVVPAISSKSITFFSLMILGLFIAKAALSMLLTHSLAHFLAKIEARSARVIVEKAFGVGLEASRIHSKDEVMFALQYGSPSAFGTVMNSLGVLVAEGFLFVMVFLTFVFVDPLTALFALAYFSLIALIIQLLVGRIMESTSRRIATSSVDSTSALGDLWEVSREAEVLGVEKNFFRRIYNSRLKVAGKSATQTVLSNSPRYVVETSLLIAVALFALSQAQKGDLASSAVTLGVFLTGGLRLTASLLPLQSAMIAIKQSAASARAALKIMEARPRVDSNNQPKAVSEHPVGALAIEMQNITFGFAAGQDSVLRDLTLSVRAGDQVALIGASGSGKSTIAEIILGLLEPQSGSVQLSGMSPQSIREIRPGIVSYVPQKPGVVSGTIVDNIALGVEPEDIDPERLEASIYQAHLRGLIQSLPLGMNTNIGKNKDELSGGQLQRIGLARALYTQPKLLIMDEATSALDAESEFEISKAINEMRGRTTVVLIAHRLNTVQHSDEVFYIEGGKVAASGKFQALLASNSSVRRLAELMGVQ